VKLAFDAGDVGNFAAAEALASLPGLAFHAGSSSFVAPAKPAGLALALEPVV
jgi:hypothetical protein